MDQIDAVRAFIEVAARESFTAAAERLGLSKALVSKHVAALETRAGTRLLNRTTRRVSLTEAGETFLARARIAVSTWDEMMESATEDSAQPSGLLRIAGPKVFGETVLAPLAAEFLAEQPHLRVELALEERRVDIVGEGFDIAIRLSEPEDSALIAVRLAPFPYVICAAPAYLARRGTPERPDDLLEHDCIVNSAISPAGQWAFRTEEGLHRVTVPFRAKVNSDQPAAAFVRAGLGIGLLIRQPVEADLAEGRLVAILPELNAYDREAYALMPHRAGMAVKTRLFLDFLRRRLRGGEPARLGAARPTA